MSKSTSKFVCQQCGYESTGWLGKCPNCDTWNSLVETVAQEISEKAVNWQVRSSDKEKTKPQKLSEIKTSVGQRISTGISELDRVLGGGIVTGSVVLLAGDPGIGKSTLLLQSAAEISGKKKQVIYVSGEESPHQIKIRAERLGVKNDNILLLPETNVERIIGELENWRTGELGAGTVPLVIVDSIQTLWTSDLSGTPGSIGQVRWCASKLLSFAKLYGIPVILVGHVTKEGGIAGPMVLAHLVDTILFLEGERYQTFRLLRGIKNRFGPTDEVGVFSMEGKGLREVSNPSEVFLSERKENVPGSITTCLMEGSRPLLVEIQALVVPTQLAVPRRVGSGMDWNRLQLLIAVLSRRARLPLGTFDIFVNVAGGLKITEPAADLAVALAIASAWADKPVDAKVCAVGEVGLLGEVRSVGQIDKRAKEARRLGFTKVIGSKEASSISAAMKLVIK